VRPVDEYTVGVSLDETATLEEVETAALVFQRRPPPRRSRLRLTAPDAGSATFAAPLARTSASSPSVFHRYHTEHEMLRYIQRLEAKDLSLCHR
jgi:glycine dehydrogenase